MNSDDKKQFSTNWLWVCLGAIHVQWSDGKNQALCCVGHAISMWHKH